MRAVTVSAHSRALIEPTFSHLVGAAQTLGPEVGELAALAGLPPDPEQQLVLDQVFAFERDGSPSAFEVGIIAPRQNLKTATLKMINIGWLFLTKERLVTWSSHEFKTTVEAFRDMIELIESTPHLDREVKSI